MTGRALPFLAALFLSIPQAHADHGAVVVELGAGMGVVSSPAAHSLEPRSAMTSTLGLTGRVAYAPQPWLELGLGGDLLPAASATVFDTNVVVKDNIERADVVQDQGAAAGWLSTKLKLPEDFHPSIELGLGVMHHFITHDRSYVRFGSGPGGLDQVLPTALDGTSATGLLVAPAVGFEVGTEHWTIGFHARLLVDVAAPGSWCLTLPLSFSWRQPL